VRHPDPPDAAGGGEADRAAHAEIQPDLGDASLRADQLENERKLGCLLGHLGVKFSVDATGWLQHEIGVNFSVDATGWLRHEIEIEVDVHRQPNSLFTGTLCPIKVRAGAEATDDPMSAVAVCALYNAALVRLHELADQVDALVREGSVRMDPGSALAYAYTNLIRLDELIAQRQGVTIGHGTVRLSTLRREVEYFSRCDAHLTPIVLAAARATSSRPLLEQPVAATRWPWRWMQWVRNRRARRRS
jgi:hypothetical protein